MGRYSDLTVDLLTCNPRNPVVCCSLQACVRGRQRGSGDCLQGGSHQGTAAGAGGTAGEVVMGHRTEHPESAADCHVFCCQVVSAVLGGCLLMFATPAALLSLC